MKLSADRLVAILALLAATTSLAFQLEFTNLLPNSAHAASPISAEAGAATDLGPADALILNDAKPAKGQEGKPVRVKAEGGRVSWSDQPTARAWSMAAVNVDRTMKAILSGSTYADKRKELETETKKQDEEFGKRLEELKKKYSNLEPNSPDVGQAQQEFNALRDEYNRWREGSLRINEKLVAEQIEKGYRELINAVEILSDKEGIDLVVRFLPTAEPFAADNLAGAREQVIGRSLLRYPEAIDITAEILKELGVKE
ncbi:MAG: OmpH family outer membrane protein [Phycisphaerae bacterium]|nr:OmpH family outer membrane protein [Phycisphaerae bacterium]